MGFPIFLTNVFLRGMSWYSMYTQAYPPAPDFTEDDIGDLSGKVSQSSSSVHEF